MRSPSVFVEGRRSRACLKMRPLACLTAIIIAALSFGASQTFAQTPPTEAQIKRDLMNPGVIAIIMRGRGSFEKFVTNGAVVNEYYRSVTVRRKTDRPGVTLDVLGDVVYRLIGGRWVYRTMRLAGNTYGGMKNPTAADINQALAQVELSHFHPGSREVIEYESFKLMDAPNWEWHTPNSVSFYAIAVFRRIHSGKRYSNESRSPTYRDGFRWIDTVREVWRVRIYRENEKSPWVNAIQTTVGKLEIPDAKGGTMPRDFLIEQKQYPANEVERMPRATRTPLISE